LIITGVIVLAAACSPAGNVGGAGNGGNTGTGGQSNSGAGGTVASGSGGNNGGTGGGSVGGGSGGAGGTVVVGMSPYDCNWGAPVFTKLDSSIVPPGGLAVANVPQFVSIGFDDNAFEDGMKWALDLLKASRTRPAPAITARSTARRRA